MVATSGDRLLQDDAMDALSGLLVNQALLVTPNLPEASLLTRRDVDTLDDMKRAADTLMSGGSHAALIKGGHMSSGGSDKAVTDLLALQSGFEVFEHARIQTTSTHGTGCTLASALAGQIANAIIANAMMDNAGRPDDATLKSATEAALDYVHRAITAAPDIGSTFLGSNGPLEHGV
jgi:hydroxymethylpyrimidine/phosphomethylpyrimidine kinase